jgi:phage protein D
MAPAPAAYVSTPVLRIGGAVDADAMSDLRSLAAEETIVGLCWCEATFNNWGIRNGAEGYLYLSRDRLDFGTTLQVAFGPEGDDRTVFSGKVSALQADYPAGEGARLLVLAEDGLQSLRITRRTRTFTDASPADIAEQIAGAHGLQADVDLDGPTRRITAQVNQSDLAFLRALARSCDGEVWLDDGTLHVKRRPDRDGGTVTLRYGGDLLSFSVRADLAHQVTEIAVTGWSVAEKDAVNETADSSVLGAELADLTSGSSLLPDSFGERRERMVRAMPLAADDARALAKAAYLERARRFVCGAGTTAGTPALRVGTRLIVTGVGPLFGGDYQVTRTRHQYDLTHGYRTEFDLERPGIGAAT